MNKIQKIKDIVSIIDIANRYGANSNSKGKCKHNPLRTEATCSLVLYPETNTYYDFGNKDGGDVIDFVCAADGFDIPDSIENICRMYNIDTNDNYIPTPKTIIVPEKDYIKPEKLLTSFNAITKRFNENTRESLFTIAPEYVFKEAKSEDKIEFFNLVRYYEPESSPVVLLPDSKGTSYTFRYRYKTIDDEQKKWVAHYNTKSNYPYCRLNENRLTLIVEGSRDFLTALLCGYSVIALPSAGFQLDNELLKDRLCVFIDDDDDKEFMKPLFENAICEKIWFEHKKFKEITKCNSKDFSDYLYQFDNLEKFKHTFEKFIYEVENVKAIDWETNINKIAKPVTLEVIKSAENTEWIYDNAIIKRNITTVVGAPNVGKSAFSFAVANTLFDNNKIDKLLYFDADNPISYVKDRIVTLIEKYGEEKIKYYNGVNSSAKEMVSVLEMLSSVSDASGLRVLIVLDSLKFFVNGSMNEDKIVSPLFDILKQVRDRFGATIIALHHTRKSKDDEGKLTYNGSQSVEASTDNMIMITKEYLYHKKSRSDRAGLKLNLSINFTEMSIEMSDFNEDEEEDEAIDKKNESEYPEIIRQFLYENGESSQASIIDKLKGKIPLRKIKKILWEDQYKNELWTFKKGEKNSWLFTAIERKSNDPIVTVYSDDDIDNIFGGME